MKRIGVLQSLVAGISSSKKTGPPNSFAFGRALDFRSESSEVTINPLSAKISGSTVTDLPMWMEIAGDYMYDYGNTGKVYQINTSDTVENEYTVADSVGNGMGYLSEDKFLYLASNTSLSRRSTGNAATGTYYANFLENEGGEPTNTRSIDFEAGSSMSATRADTASLSITGDITLETFIKPESMPAAGGTMALISKWNESGTLRSYKLSLIGLTNAFGDGGDGALTVSGNTTDAPIDSTCTGTSGSLSLSATNASFAAGQKILIIQMQGTGAGTKQVNTIVSYTAGTITLQDALNATYTTGAQVLVRKQYTNITINSGITLTVKAWDRSTLKGGVLSYYASGTFTNNGTIIGKGLGFKGGDNANLGIVSHHAYQGDSPTGQGGTNTGGQLSNNGSGGGSIGSYSSTSGVGHGGGHGSSGGGIWGGSVTGSADLTTMTMGGGGGGAFVTGGISGGDGGYGGAIVFITATTIATAGTITVAGNNGGDVAPSSYGGGGGAGGSVLLEFQTATLGTGITAAGGSGGTPLGNVGGAGGQGRINLNYLTSYTGTTTPTANAVLDSTLGSSAGYGLRFYVSSTGDNSETYTYTISDPTAQWNRYSVAWDASASTAYFYQNGESLGTRVGALTAIHNNASIFGLATFVSSGSANTDFYDGLMDDVRVWNDIRTASEISSNNGVVLTGSESNLVAYYKADSDVTDSQTSGLNDLTANNTPTYSTDIPFSGITTRSDQDVAIAGSGQAYTLTTAINEGATHRQTFTPTKEPLKSVALTIATVSTGNVTVVIHDELNRELTSVTVAQADLVAGVYEFIFASSVRPVLNADYHLHIYSSVADGTISSSVASDLEGAYFRSYFQILVSDTYHPIEQFTNFLVIGNERYVAKLEAGSVYNPHRLTLPSGYRVRCFGFWRDFIAIGTWQGSNVTDQDNAKILFWDGTSDTYVEPLDVPQGAINSLFGRQGKLLISAGYRGQFFEYTGGEEAYPLFRVPLSVRSDKIEIAPGALTMWNGIIQIGVALSTDSTTIHEGVYTWGRDELSDPYALGFDYPLSIGDQMSTSVKVGSVLPRGKKLYIGYENAGQFGIDVVDKSANPYATATVELLNIDLQNVADVKYPLTFRCDFLPLVSGQSVTLKYKPDRLSTWYTLQTQDDTSATEVAGSIFQRVKEVQFAVDYVTNGSQLTTINYAFDVEDSKSNLRQVK